MIAHRRFDVAPMFFDPLSEIEGDERFQHSTLLGSIAELCEFFQQRFGLLQLCRINALREPVVHLSELEVCPFPGLRALSRSSAPARAARRGSFAGRTRVSHTGQLPW